MPMSPGELKVDKTFTFPGAAAFPGGQSENENVVAFEIGKVDGKSAYVDVALPRDRQAKAASDFADAVKSLGTIDIGGVKVQSCASKPKCVKLCTVPCGSRMGRSGYSEARRCAGKPLIG